MLMIKNNGMSFPDFVQMMREEFGEAFDPYLKSFYDTAREMLEMQGNPIAGNLSPAEDVKSFICIAREAIKLYLRRRKTIANLKNALTQKTKKMPMYIAMIPEAYTSVPVSQPSPGPITRDQIAAAMIRVAARMEDEGLDPIEDAFQSELLMKMPEQKMVVEKYDERIMALVEIIMRIPEVEYAVMMLEGEDIQAVGEEIAQERFEELTMSGILDEMAILN